MIVALPGSLVYCLGALAAAVFSGRNANLFKPLQV